MRDDLRMFKGQLEACCREKDIMENEKIEEGGLAELRVKNRSKARVQILNLRVCYFSFFFVFQNVKQSQVFPPH